MFRLTALCVALVHSTMEENEVSSLLQTKNQMDDKTSTEWLAKNLVVPKGMKLHKTKNGKNVIRGRYDVPECQAPLMCARIACFGGEKCNTPAPRLAVDKDGRTLCVMKQCEECTCEHVRPPPQVVAGRPFSTDAGDLHSLATWDASAVNVWATTDLTEMPPEVTPTVAKIASEHWRETGEHEHASVASFSRASLDLMRFGGPPNLLLDTHTAAQEEVGHADIAFSVASLFRNNSESVVIGQFPSTTIELSSSLDEFAAKLLLEGCVGETSAVARLNYALAHVGPTSPVSRHLVTLRDEEAKHAALAWNTLHWALSQGASVQLPEFAMPANSPVSTDSWAALTWGGVVPTVASSEINHAVNMAIVVPWLASMRDSTEFPETISQGPYADAVNQAADVVRQHVTKITV